MKLQYDESPWAMDDGALTALCDQYTDNSMKTCRSFNSKQLYKNTHVKLACWLLHDICIAM